MTTDRTIQRATKAFQKEDADAQRLGLTAAVSTSQGRRFLWNLLAQANIFSPSFTENALRTAFNEGRRSLGLELLDNLNEVAPDAYLLMIKENADVLRIRSARLADLTRTEFTDDSDGSDPND